MFSEGLKKNEKKKEKKEKKKKKIEGIQPEENAFHFIYGTVGRNSRGRDA